MEDNNPILVYTANSYSDYLLAVSLLDAEGIPYLVKNEGVQSLVKLSLLAPITGPIKIYVRSEDSERAKEILTGEA